MKNLKGKGGPFGGGGRVMVDVCLRFIDHVNSFIVYYEVALKQTSIGL
jgi:hypothetical protein